jgi:tetratricopeptide (TPR) repeat protein
VSAVGPSTLALLLATAIGAGPSGAGEHLLVGATAFREGRFAQALVEFRVAERLGAEEARSYAGAALVKLGRPEEAVEVFGPAPIDGEDALLSWYRALALRGAGLLLSADAALEELGDRAGPRIAAEVARLRGDIAGAVEAVPSSAAIDAALGRAASLRAQGRVALAAATYREAAALAARGADPRRQAEAERASGELGALAARREP